MSSVNNSQKKDVYHIKGPWSPQEDEMLQSLVEKHDRDWSLIGESIPGRSGQSCKSRWFSLYWPFTPEEDEIIIHAQARFGNNYWGTNRHLLSGHTYEDVQNYWDSTLKWKSSSMTNEDMTIVAPDIHVPPPSFSDTNRGQWSSFIHDGNLSHEVQGVGGHQPPSISNMVRANMSFGGTHSYSSHNEPASSLNAFNKRDLSLMMIGSVNVQEIPSDEFDWSTYFEHNIKELVQEAQFRWLRPAEVLFILECHEETQLNHEHPQKPPSGSLFLFNKRNFPFFDEDGHKWRKKKDRRTVEAHERLKVGNIEALNCYYAYGEENPNFQRRIYWVLLEPALEHIVLVHYRDIMIESLVSVTNTGTHNINIPPPDLNSSLAVGGVSGQAPCVGDILRDESSQPSGGTHPYRGKQSAPSRQDAFKKPDSSPMMIESDNVQEFVGIDESVSKDYIVG